MTSRTQVPDGQASGTASGAGRCRWMAWSAVFAGSLLLYGATASRTIQWQDFGQYVQRVVEGELLSPFGLALAHPLHFWLSTAAVRILPVEPPFAVSLVSATFGAVAVANVFGLVRTLTGRVVPAVLAATGLAVAHTFWRMSTMPECYTLTAALLAAEVWSLARWDRARRPAWLVTAFLANGLGFANHNLALLTSPVVAAVLCHAVWRRQAGRRAFVASGVAWMLGASPYLVLIAQQVMASDELLSTLVSAFVGNTFHGAVAGNDLALRNTAVSIAFTVLSFPNLTLAAALLGLARGRRTGLMPPLTYAVVVAGLSLHLLFVLRYNVIDQYTFLVPAYALVSVLAGTGYAVAVERFTRGTARGMVVVAAGLTALTPLLYAAVPAVAMRFGALGAHVRNKPYRDDYRYLFLPWGRADTSAERMSREAVELAGPTGFIIVSDEMGMFALRYQRAVNARPGITLTSKVEEGAIHRAHDTGQPVVWIPRGREDPPPPAPNDWRRVGDLYVLPASGASAR